MDFDNLIWTCHVCGKERPDDKIRVYSRDLSSEFGFQLGTISQHVRYCEDNPDCVFNAPRIRLITKVAMPKSLT